LVFYSFQSFGVAKTTTEEFQTLNFITHTSRMNFDPKGKINNLYASQLPLHSPLLEYLWDNLQDDFEVRKRGYERLKIPQMKDFGVITDVPKEVTDDGITLDPCYKID
jgi:hypothetical protein